MFNPDHSKLTFSNFADFANGNILFVLDPENADRITEACRNALLNGEVELDSRPEGQERDEHIKDISILYLLIVYAYHDYHDYYDYNMELIKEIVQKYPDKKVDLNCMANNADYICHNPGVTILLTLCREKDWDILNILIEKHISSIGLNLDVHSFDDAPQEETPAYYLIIDNQIDLLVKCLNQNGFEGGRTANTVLIIDYLVENNEKATALKVLEKLVAKGEKIPVDNQKTKEKLCSLFTVPEDMVLIEKLCSLFTAPEDMALIMKNYSASEIKSLASNPLLEKYAHTSSDYIRGVVYNDLNSEFYDPDLAFRCFEEAGQYLPALKAILPCYIAAICNEEGNIENPQAFAAAQQTAATILSQEPDNEQARAFLDREKNYKQSIKITEKFNTIVTQPMKSLVFLTGITKEMHQTVLFERKNGKNARYAKDADTAQTEWDNNYGLTHYTPPSTENKSDLKRKLQTTFYDVDKSSKKSHSDPGITKVPST